MQIVSAQLRRDALDIWQAGVAAVDSERLVAETLRVEGNELIIGRRAVSDWTHRPYRWSWGRAKRGPAWRPPSKPRSDRESCDEKQLAGWVNVPADCVRPLRRIQLHAARRPGSTSRRPGGVAATEEILRLVESPCTRGLVPLPDFWRRFGAAAAPREGITLDDKLALTRHLSAAGADIDELNTVRKQLSRIKGGGLARGLPRRTTGQR